MIGTDYKVGDFVRMTINPSIRGRILDVEKIDYWNNTYSIRIISGNSYDDILRTSEFSIYSCCNDEMMLPQIDELCKI